MDPSDLVQVGRVVKPHGLRGEVVVEAMTDVPERFAPGVDLRVDGQVRTVVASRPHQGRVLVLFDGVSDRGDAEGLRNAEILAEPVEYDTTDVYWAHEIVGMQVRDAEGNAYGTVRDVIELPDAAGYDLLEVEHAGTTWLLPASDDLVEVEDVDGAAVLVVIDPPAGLLPGTEDAAVNAAPDVQDE